MKQKIKVQIYKTGSLNKLILAMVAAHNGGEINASICHMEGAILQSKVEYPTSNKEVQFASKDNVLVVSEDAGKTLTLSLEWHEEHELQDDIPEGLFTTGVCETEKEVIEELNKNK